MLSRTAARQPTTQRTASRAEHSTLAMLPRAAQAMPLARMLSLATGAPARVAPLGRRVVRGARHLATGQAATGTASEEAPSTSGTQRICILGGGFAGLYTAVRLESLMWPRGSKPSITLVDKSDKFVFKPLLYELLNGGATAAEVAPSFQSLLAPYSIRFVQGSVAGVAPEAPLRDGGSAGGGAVTLESGETLGYDWLVVALGAEADARGIPGVKEHAVPFQSLEDAVRIKDRLEALSAGGAAAAVGGEPRPSVVIVGAGYSGVELASVIAEKVAGAIDVKIVTPALDILDGCPVGQQEAARRTLQSQGVQILTGQRVSSLGAAEQPPSEPQADDTSCSVRLESGGGESTSYTTMDADLVLWTAGFSPVTRSRSAAFPFDASPRGQLLTDATLRLQKHCRVFALGDVSGPLPDDAEATSGLPATAQVAFQQADYAAWNLWAAINGRPLLPFRYQHLGSMMALGQRNAAVALPLSLPRELTAAVDSTPLGALLAAAGVRLGGPEVTLEGPLAAALRRAAYLYRQPTGEQRTQVAASWLSQAADVFQAVSAELMGANARR